MKRSIDRETRRVAVHLRLAMILQRIWQRHAMLHIVYQALAARMPTSEPRFSYWDLQPRGTRSSALRRLASATGTPEPQHTGLCAHLRGRLLPTLGLRLALARVELKECCDSDALAHILI